MDAMEGLHLWEYSTFWLKYKESNLKFIWKSITRCKCMWITCAKYHVPRVAQAEFNVHLKNLNCQWMPWQAFICETILRFGEIWGEQFKALLLKVTKRKCMWITSVSITSDILILKFVNVWGIWIFINLHGLVQFWNEWNKKTIIPDCTKT